MCVRFALLGLGLTFLSSLTPGLRSVNSFLSECEMPACGRPEIQPISSRIVGGHESLPGSLPWMAMLVWCDYMKCGGTILNDQFILTAAHCFDEPQVACYSPASAVITQPTTWTVYLGKHSVLRTNEGESRMQVESVIVHPLYDNRTYRNDVALLKLKGRVKYSPLIRPLCLPFSPSSPLASDVPSVGQACIVAGYGQTFTIDTYTLHQVTVPILSDHQCSQPDWYGASFFPPDQFCAGYPTGRMDACLGDSGSPLICLFDGVWYASGMVSQGLGCAQPKKPGVYANLSFHQPWIQATMEHHGLLPACP